jgi:hypothetical protein
MKKVVLLILFTYLFLHSLLAQNSSQDKPTKKGIGINLSAAIQLPVGDFSSTHLLGLGFEVSPSYHTTGLFSKIKIAFTYNGGVAYYLGKKETVSSYSYTYPGYFFIHAFAGALLIPSHKIEISLTGGPALGIYNGNTLFNLGSKVDLNFHLNNKVSVGPGIVFMKEPGADPLWAVSAKIMMSI